MSALARRARAGLPPRTLIVAGAVIAVEVWLYLRYAELGAQFHFWLHGLFGGAIGLGLLAAWRLVRPTALSPWGPGFLGHLYSAFPDVLFLSAGIVHMYWMDAFAFHISLHFIPAPLWWMLGVFVLALSGERLAAHRRRAATLGALMLSVGAVVLGLALRAPLPDTLQDVRAAPGIAVMCPLAPVEGQPDVAHS